MKHWMTYCILALALSVSACKRPSNPYDLPYKAPVNAPPIYKKGWEHGCKSGYSAYGNDIYKTFYKFTQDIELMNDQLYYKAWTDSFHYCRAYVNRLLAGYAFRKPAEGDTYGVFSTSRLNFIRPTVDTRNRSALSKRGLGFGPFGGVNPPGWGKQGWGANIKCQQNWLGAKPKGCGWMGNEAGSGSGSESLFGSTKGGIDAFLGY